MRGRIGLSVGAFERKRSGSTRRRKPPWRRSESHDQRGPGGFRGVSHLQSGEDFSRILLSSLLKLFLSGSCDGPDVKSYGASSRIFWTEILAGLTAEISARSTCEAAARTRSTGIPQ